MDLYKRLRVDCMERYYARDGAEFIIRQVNEADWMVREARDIECNSRSYVIGGINYDITNLSNEVKRDWYEVVMDGDYLTPTKVEVRRLSSKINKVRDGSRGKRPIGGKPSIGTRLRRG